MNRDERFTFFRSVICFNFDDSPFTIHPKYVDFQYIYGERCIISHPIWVELLSNDSLFQSIVAVSSFWTLVSFLKSSSLVGLGVFIVYEL